MEKLNENPGHLTDANQINNRVSNNVSTYGHLSVSETGHATLTRMDRDTPENELLLRGFQ